MGPVKEHRICFQEMQKKWHTDYYDYYDSNQIWISEEINVYILVDLSITNSVLLTSI